MCHLSSIVYTILITGLWTKYFIPSIVGEMTREMRTRTTGHRQRLLPQEFVVTPVAAESQRSEPQRSEPQRSEPQRSEPQRSEPYPRWSCHLSPVGLREPARNGRFRIEVILKTTVIWGEVVTIYHWRLTDGDDDDERRGCRRIVVECPVAGLLWELSRDRSTFSVSFDDFGTRL